MSTDIVIDALYGIGAKNTLPDEDQNIINIVNKSNAYCLPIDIPSEISASDGKILGSAIKANNTVTFHCKKLGHLLIPGKKYSVTIYLHLHFILE